jgi:hypothetical protein
MHAYVICFDLVAGPSGKLPVDIGVLEAAEEHGLLWVLVRDGRVYALPEGAVWGEFSDAASALEAFNRALGTAWDLLGFLVEARALAIPLDETVRLRACGKTAADSFRPADRFTASLFQQLYAPPPRGRGEELQPARAS